MNLKARAECFCELVRLTVESSDDVMTMLGWIDIKEAERLKDDLTLALQSYDEYMATLNKAANEFMEE